MERTLVLVKPDGVQRGLVGAIVDRFERPGLRLVGLKLIRIDRAVAERHYAEHRARPFFPQLVAFVTSSPVVAMVWTGPGAVALVRTMMGATDPATAPPGTIRGDYGIDVGQNVVHGSDGAERAEEEIALYFGPDELIDWERDGERWVHAGG